MTQNYSTDQIAQQLQQLDLPFPDFLAQALCALLTAKKASVRQITQLIPGEQSAEAKRQQMRRVLDCPQLGQGAWARAIAHLLPKGAWRLALDRTEWKWGEQTVNLLVLSVLYGNLAVPLLWIVMPEPGASDSAERIALMKQFLKGFGLKRIEFLTADREFIGKQWVGWLLEQKVPFRIRIKVGELLERPDGVRRRAGQWFSEAVCACKKRRWSLWGLSVYVGSARLRSGEVLVVISNERGQPAADYRLRWKIEVMFQALKGRGFDMESSRLLDPVRLSAFFGFLALALCWCLKMGVFLCALKAEQAPPLKKHGRYAQSVFALGLDYLQRLLAPLTGNPSRYGFLSAVGLLRPTGTE